MSPVSEDALRRGRALELSLDAVGRRAKGRHFTTEAVASAMAQYAVPRPGARALDPACGAGALLAAARERSSRVTGVDADPEAVAAARRVLGAQARVVRADFLGVEPGALGDPFDAVLVNPPYLRQEAIAPQRKAELRSRFATTLSTAGSGRLDLLGYFLLHLDRFLRTGGRLAFLASAAWLTSGYGRVIRTFLARNYQLDQVTESAVEPWFPEARTRAVLVLARKVDDVPGRHRVLFRRLHAPLRDRPVPGTERAVATSDLADGRPWGERLRMTGALEDLLTAFPQIWAPLSERATPRFGMKTGADRFFVLRDGVDGHGDRWTGDPAALRPLLLSPMELDGIEIRAQDLRRNLLVLPPDADRDPNVARHLRRGERRAIPDRPTCSARERQNGPGRWFSLQPGPQPPVVWARTEQYRHVVAANPEGVVVNNNLVGLWPGRTTTVPGLLASLNSAWTFLVRYAYGRVSNEGKVKTEVGDLRRLPALDPDQLGDVSLGPLRGRPIEQVHRELRRSDRRSFEHDVLTALGVPPRAAGAWIERLTTDVTRIVEQEQQWERRYRRGKHAVASGVVVRRTEYP